MAALRNDDHPLASLVRSFRFLIFISAAINGTLHGQAMTQAVETAGVQHPCATMGKHVQKPLLLTDRSRPPSHRGE